MTGENCSIPNAYILFTAFDIFLAFKGGKIVQLTDDEKSGRRDDNYTPIQGCFFLWYCSVGVSSGLILNEAIASCLSSKTNVHCHCIV
ncbi:hypothetical protein AW089_26450 [Escherichia coli]|nr:hypothetical protein AW089_26450 [Escherichia coli]